jgi:2-polyprenyl-3-methyl-5-hydroxy-6-metoxy-1,4-benzoquinol methylase
MAACPALDDEGIESPVSAAPAPGGSCRWCGRTFTASATRLRERALCARCGAATSDPVSEEELDRAYAGWYRPDDGRFSGPGDALLRRSRGHLARRLDEIAPEGPVLDVGSGDGALLDALAARGRAAIGLERVSSRPDVHSGEVAEVEGPWAAIVLWHTLEHLGDAGAALDHLCSTLLPQGVVVIAMPNPDSLQARAFGDRWLALDLPRHRVHVPASSLLARLRDLGLRVERVSHLRGGQTVFGWLHGLVGWLPGHADLYDAIRRPDARSAPMSAGTRAGALAASVALLPLAATLALAEAALQRGGSTYVEARRV